MAISSEILYEFAKITNDTVKDKSETTVYGTAVEYDGGIHIKLDGSDRLTPVVTTTDILPGDRVMVMIKNHTATVTGNISSPAARKEAVDEVSKNVEDVGSKIDEFEIVIANKVDTKVLDAEKARIDALTADNVTIKERLTANEADIDTLEADNAAITGKLTANEAEITDLKTNKLDVTIAEAKYATVENLTATNETVYNLNATYGEFASVTTSKLDAHTASIDSLEANKLSASQADLAYAKIDFTNIGTAAIEYFYATSGLIKDVVVGQGTVTGELVGVTIKGDLIEGSTVKADKLVILGEDGLYYKLNTNGVTTEAEQTQYNSLDGSHILAQSITATKINVDDLVAFDATIGGFNITDSAIYSNTKASMSNTTAGLYFGKDGQINVGDGNNFLKYYKDTNGTWKLEIAAGSIKIGSSNKSVEEALNTTIKESVEEFYKSISPTSLSGGSWSQTSPDWTEGSYIWRRTKITYGNGTNVYSPSVNGVCITGNTGAQGKKGDTGDTGGQGPQGEKGDTGNGISTSEVTYQASTSGTAIPTGTWSSSIPSVEAGSYLWTKTVLTYTNGNSTTSYAVGKMGNTGATGSTGKGIKSTTITYQAGSSQTEAPTGAWGSSVPNLSTSLPYLWTKTVITYTDDVTSTSYSVSSTLESFEIGGRNLIQSSMLKGVDGSSTEEFTATVWATELVSSEDLLSIIEPSTEYVLSCNAELTERTEVPTKFDLNCGFSFYSSTTSDAIRRFTFQNLQKETNVIGDTDSISIAFITPSVLPSDYKILCYTRRWTTNGSEPIGLDTITFTNLKFEKGNKATDWTPAPEDFIDNTAKIVDEAKIDIGHTIESTVSQTVTDYIGDKTLVTDAENSGKTLYEIVTNVIQRTSSLEQTSKGWSMDFSTIETKISELDGKITTEQLERLKYIRFDEGQIILGDKDTLFQVVITNENIAFNYDGQTLSYIDTTKLNIEQAYIKEAEVRNNLWLGSFRWFKRANGNLSLKFNE